MIRGTTAPFKFNVPYDTSTISTMVATFSQKHNNGTAEEPLPIEKWYIKDYGAGEVIRNDGFAFSDTNPNEIQTSLTEEQTLRFSDKEKAYMQIRVQFATDEGTRVVGSKPVKITVYPVNDNVGNIL